MPASTVSNPKGSSTLTLTTPSDREIAMSRVFDAPAHLVFEAYTSPQHVPHWLLGPEGWTMPVCEIDLRVGGKWRYIWRHPDGRELDMHGVYREIAPPDRVVPTESWGPEWPETINTVTFTETDGKTTLTITTLCASKENRDAMLKTGMAGGVSMSFDRLVTVLRRMISGVVVSTYSELVITRVFDAPREIVFKAWTDQDRLKQWWGPKYFTTPVCELDPRPGGAIKIHMRGPDGTIYPMLGFVREIVEPERLVMDTYVPDAEGNPLFKVTNTVTFEEQGGKTKITVHADVTMATPAAAPSLAGMEQGWSETVDRLGSFLERRVQ